MDPRVKPGDDDRKVGVGDFRRKLSERLSASSSPGLTRGSMPERYRFAGLEGCLLRPLDPAAMIVAFRKQPRLAAGPARQAQRRPAILGITRLHPQPRYGRV